ncbi:glycosyl transferase [Mytilinidion resinicola]|uniref:Glycosyl transferase n=1 Tax=Mytilinidion resinicola TaxID=574789 RepID=A0A6A6YK81_9PEZI|nr:glycosyl transferase [Mytilinidion resinicola]KAF2808374.1 glycosyl transferase [Mytilinidion resinicola]
MVHILGISAFSQGPLQHWWQWALVAIVASSALLGILSSLWVVTQATRAYFKKKAKAYSIPRGTSHRLRKITASTVHNCSLRPLPSKPSNFGVYLGSLSIPPTEDQLTLLSRWDAIILDTSQPGVIEALDCVSKQLPQHVIDRLHLEEYLDAKVDHNNEVISKKLSEVFNTIQSCGKLTGILIAGWRTMDNAVDLVAKLISSYGLEVYLEVGPPDFLEGRSPNLSLFSGLVVKNATILLNGERRDYFEMSKMRSTTKAFVSESCRRPFLVMMWETIDDDARLSHAVLRRSYMWCGYHGALPWIGRTASITDASRYDSFMEPLAAFQWLKDRKVMAIHEVFRTNQNLKPTINLRLEADQSFLSLFPSMQDIFDIALDDTASDRASNLDGRLSSSTVTLQDRGTEDHGDHNLENLDFEMPEWAASMPRCAVNPLSCSTSGTLYECFGCFPIGLDVNLKDLEAILESQRRLRRLNLLARPSKTQLDDAVASYARLAECDGMTVDIPAHIRHSIRDLVERLSKPSEEAHKNQIEVYIGLDSGFRTPAGAQFWAIHDANPSSGSSLIYVSKSVQDLTGVLLHTYLSSCKFSRYQCCVAEFALHNLEYTPGDRLPMPIRFHNDLEILSPSDLLLFLQHMRFSDSDRDSALLAVIRASCQNLLINQPSLAQLKRKCNTDYLSGACTDEDIVTARLDWYRQLDFDTISKESGIEIFRQVHHRFVDLLNNRDYDSLDRINSELSKLVEGGSIDWRTDFVLFCVLSAAKRLAFEEVYIEVQDRNPLFNQFSDQSAAFAELFALGSRCEAYFDVTPSDFGVLLSEKHRRYYSQAEHQPPKWIGNAPSFASAYAAAQTDIDPNTVVSTMPGYRRFTFLSVFAIPALIDILLLTTTGRGLYLSAFMPLEDQRYATLALMVSLLLSGAIGTWISIGGTYYLISMAFSAASMFMLTRLLGGLAFTVVGGFVGFIVISAVHNARAGAIFFFYLLGLTSYLSVLAVLSTHQIPASSFLNGRRMILYFIPTLAISPIITLWVRGYDSIIYLAVLYLFLMFLMLGTRHVCSEWATWYHSVKTLDDSAVKAWYTGKLGTPNAQSQETPVNSKACQRSSTNFSARLTTEKRTRNRIEQPALQSSQIPTTRLKTFDSLTEPAILALCRSELFKAVMDEKHRRFWQKATTDPLVKELALCWDSTVFLLEWYCRTSEVKRPIPYSSTWNLMSQVALDNMQQTQKGIRLHNSFIHWRNIGDEVGCSILYFIVALLDRWIILIEGAQLVGLSAALDKTFRLAVGFALAYYLLGAVILDYKAQHLHQASEQHTPDSITEKSQIQKAVLHDQHIRRRLYVSTLGRFLGVHVWALSLSTAFIWIFNGSEAAMIMFLSYVAAYSGLLLYQYNKIFSGPHALLPLSAAVLTGFPVGFILKGVYPAFEYSGVIALGTATWTAALLSLRTAKLGRPEVLRHVVRGCKRLFLTKSFQDSLLISKPPNTKSPQCFRAYCDGGVNAEWNQDELEALYSTLRFDFKEARFKVLPFDYPGIEIKSLLLSCNYHSLSKLALRAFPTAPYMMQNIISTWERGFIDVYIVSTEAPTHSNAGLRAISFQNGSHITLLVASERSGRNCLQPKISSNCQVIAETLIHACAESLFGLQPLEAGILESLLACKAVHAKSEIDLSENSKRAFSSDIPDKNSDGLVASIRQTLLATLCLGIDCDTQWERLPSHIRRSLIQRCIGVSHQFSSSDLEWIKSNVGADSGCDVMTSVSRYDLGAFLQVQKMNHLRDRVSLGLYEVENCQTSTNIHAPRLSVRSSRPIPLIRKLATRMKAPFVSVYHSLGIWIKFFALAGMGDPEYQRELIYTLKTAPRPSRRIARFFLTGIWIYNRAAQALVLPLFLYYGRPDLKKMSNTIKGNIITQGKSCLIVENYERTETIFIHSSGIEGYKLYVYPGAHKEEPKTGHTMVSTFGHDMKLYSRKEYTKGDVTNEFVYDYNLRFVRRHSKILKWDNPRIPLAKTCIGGKDEGAVFRYNYKGHVDSGSYLLHGNLVRFQYHYRKNAKYDDELLRAEFILPHLSCNVSWCAPPARHADKPERWIPTPRVYEATFVQGADVYECSWLYDHKFHPTIATKLNGEFIDTPEMIRHDWLGVLKKPNHCAFADENPLIGFRKPTSTFISRLFRTNSKTQPVSTARARSQLWKAWKKRVDLDGVTTRWVDEQLLRREPLLRPYWRRRDRGSLTKAEDYLALHADAIMATSDVSSDISAWTPLAVRMSDLFSFGQGGDAVIYTRTKTLQRDTDDSLHVIAVDTGTWPNEGGGVSACRRDLINNLRTIKWHMVVESANDFGIPKHQTEENVESLKIIPLWGLDFMHPCHGMFSNKLDSEVDHIFYDATLEDIRINFLPTLTALVQGARAVNMTQAHVKQATRALINLNNYFQDSRHWKEVWTTDLVKNKWRELWLADDMPNTQPPSQWFETELPTLSHLDTALELWFRYLFIFSIPVPEKIPAVFQASHHSVSASYGIVCKIKRGCTLQIWDHAISWRETNLYLSSTMCTLPPFIRNSLLGLMRLTSTLILYHADQILPCADFFNPGWEVEIGTSQGALAHRNVFRRKVDPIVNGITDMQKFAPISEIKTKQPTVTMLSHVWFAKDIKTALLAADIISNEWGFKDYKLDIYGALNKAPVYSSECQEILACKGLGGSVTLRGTADPTMVLENTWLFLNSSVSEGLPLALGEAALTGAPVVCTDVGASLRVLTDPDTGARYSEVVAPNDAYGLARAQINLLAMLDDWAQYADDDPEHPAPILPHKPTPEDVKVITRRMYEKSGQRRKLGMMAREIVQKSFSGERYLREHEQMLWVGKSVYEMRKQRLKPVRQSQSYPSSGFTQERAGSGAQTPDLQLEKMQHPLHPPTFRHLSTATSFSSVYIDDPGPSTRNDDWGMRTLGRSGEKLDLETGIQVEKPALVRLSGGPVSYENEKGKMNMNMRMFESEERVGSGKRPRFGGEQERVASARSSARMRSGLCEVQNADEGT